MDDLYQSAVSRDEFRRWLDLGTAPFTAWQEQKAGVMLSRLEKDPSVDYLYRTGITQGSSVSWDSSMLFCGVYDREHRSLYLTKDSLRVLASGTSPLVTDAGPSMVEEICGRINQYVEDAIANDRDRLSVQEVTGWPAAHDLEYHLDRGAKREALQMFLDNRGPDGKFHSGYEWLDLPETDFLAYIADPEQFVRTEAEQYIEKNQNEFLLQFLKNDALLAEYQTLIQDTDDPAHRIKAIMEAVRGCGAKAVTVTLQKDGQELTFKAAADLLTRKNYYNTYNIPASARGEFERLFGRQSGFASEDVAKITYGRNTIYEAPPVQSEEMGPVIQMGGM